MKNIKFNKKKVASLLLALGIMITPTLSKADIKSYAGVKSHLTDGREITLYYSNDYNKSLISLDGKLGFIDNEYISDLYFDTNNYFSEFNYEDFIRVDNATVYSDPDDKNVIGYLPKDTKVHIYASTIDGYYVVYANNMMGFIEQSSLIEQVYVEPEYEETYDYTDSIETILVTKVTGNNINVRSTPRKADNIIGFCDKTDKFVILDHVDGYYEVDYLGKIGYISDKYVTEEAIAKSDMTFTRMARLKRSCTFYTDNTFTNYYCYLPENQNIFIISEEGNYYRVMVDGVIGYVEKSNTKRLTETSVVIDLSRQMLKVVKNGKEVFRCRIISGRQSLQTNLGCFTIGHKERNYQLTPEHLVSYWIEFDGNIGIHDATWQKDKYFTEVGNKAYDNYSRGRGKTYPYDHGSHGCSNTRMEDVSQIYDLVHKNDNVLVIEQNDLIRNKCLSSVDVCFSDNYIFAFEQYEQDDKETVKIYRIG